MSDHRTHLSSWREAISYYSGVYFLESAMSMRSAAATGAPWIRAVPVVVTSPTRVLAQLPVKGGRFRSRTCASPSGVS